MPSGAKKRRAAKRKRAQKAQTKSSKRGGDSQNYESDGCKFKDREPRCKQEGENDVKEVAAVDLLLNEYEHRDIGHGDEFNVFFESRSNVIPEEVGCNQNVEHVEILEVSSDSEEQNDRASRFFEEAALSADVTSKSEAVLGATNYTKNLHSTRSCQDGESSSNSFYKSDRRSDDVKWDDKAFSSVEGTVLASGVTSQPLSTDFTAKVQNVESLMDDNSSSKVTSDDEKRNDKTSHFPDQDVLSVDMNYKSKSVFDTTNPSVDLHSRGSIMDDKSSSNSPGMCSVDDEKQNDKASNFLDESVFTGDMASRLKPLMDDSNSVAELQRRGSNMDDKRGRSSYGNYTVEGCSDDETLIDRDSNFHEASVLSADVNSEPKSSVDATCSPKKSRGSFTDDKFHRSSSDDYMVEGSSDEKQNDDASELLEETVLSIDEASKSEPISYAVNSTKLHSRVSLMDDNVNSNISDYCTVEGSFVDEAQNDKDSKRLEECVLSCDVSTKHKPVHDATNSIENLLCGGSFMDGEISSNKCDILGRTCHEKQNYTASNLLGDAVLSADVTSKSEPFLGATNSSDKLHSRGSLMDIISNVSDNNVMEGSSDEKQNDKAPIFLEETVLSAGVISISNPILSAANSTEKLHSSCSLVNDKNSCNRSDNYPLEGSPCEKQNDRPSNLLEEPVSSNDEAYKPKPCTAATHSTGNLHSSGSMMDDKNNSNNSKNEEEKGDSLVLEETDIGITAVIESVSLTLEDVMDEINQNAEKNVLNEVNNNTDNDTEDRIYDEKKNDQVSDMLEEDVLSSDVTSKSSPIFNSVNSNEKLHKWGILMDDKFSSNSSDNYPVEGSSNEKQIDKASNLLEKDGLSVDVTSKPEPAIDASHSTEKGSIMDDMGIRNSSNSKEENVGNLGLVGANIGISAVNGSSTLRTLEDDRDETSKDTDENMLNSVANMRNPPSYEKEAEALMELSSGEKSVKDSGLSNHSENMDVSKMISAEQVEDNSIPSDQVQTTKEARTAKTTSWRSCCGLFDVLTGANR